MVQAEGTAGAKALGLQAKKAETPSGQLSLSVWVSVCSFVKSRKECLSCLSQGISSDEKLDCRPRKVQRGLGLSHTARQGQPEVQAVAADHDS